MGGNGMAMDNKGIVFGQHAPQKRALARHLRREMTPAEALLWHRLRRNQWKGLHFRRHQVIDGFIVDFYCHAAGLVIELDGSVHETHAAYDAERDEILTRRGLKVLRFSNDRVEHELKTVLAEIDAATQQRL
jgi:very-short-patch-repair endonuclease